MQKADLKSLVTQMYEELLQKIDENDGVSKKKVVEYLNNSAITINSIDDTKIDSSKQAKDLFLNTYKDIAKKSLNSYENTSEKFEQLSQVHQQALSGYKNSHTDFPAIKDKFHEIQIDMNQEILKANATISKLTKQIQELEESSNLDSLTKVFNRRALTSYLSRVCEKGNIHSNLHLLILDIDDFKQINDTHGHIAGDKILIFIANILRHTLRDGDKVFRYGGEEFIITLNRIDKSKCKDVGKRILHLINKNKLIYKGNTLGVTMSIGATRYYPGDLPDKIIARADRALYKSKQNGKNQMNTEDFNGN